jgi:tetratricopeptide (TPR) repeat protein
MSTSRFDPLEQYYRGREDPVMGVYARKLLFAVFALFSLLAVNSAYLLIIRLVEGAAGRTYQGYFYQLMFLLHLALGLLMILPVLIFGGAHLSRAWKRSNRRAVHAGLALFISALILLFGGVLLSRVGFFEVNDPNIRQLAYWIHVLSPLAVIGLFVLHRLAGTRVRWEEGWKWGAVAGVFTVLIVIAQVLELNRIKAPSENINERLFLPSLARSSSGQVIPAQELMRDDYCRQCHEDIVQSWEHSVHRLSSFNNPAYLFSVRETRRVSLERNGDRLATRFCAGCHDPVPLFSGALDDPNYDERHDPTASAGITCTTCHAITRINSPRGNADYTIEVPTHYPFAFSENPVLRWISRQLIKARPDFHKKTFLKDFHKSAEFCSTCHKVHLPKAVNNYKWLRGQNHYDAYLLSGVSGHGVSSFYYPPKAVHKCASCHMPLQRSNDFAAKYFDDSGKTKVHDHLFAAANTAVPYMLGLPKQGNDQRRSFLSGIVRVDVFGVRKGGTIDGPLIAPLRPKVPLLEPGHRYLLEVVIRTLKLGHLFTQGTADSNEIWLDITVSSAGQVIGRSGAMDRDGTVDAWSHFVNACVLDRHGRRIDRRNAQDIFVALYNHQIPPGAADVVHYALEVPKHLTAPLMVKVKLQYRKFDTTYLKYIKGKDFTLNDLPITTLATDRVTFPVKASQRMADAGEVEIEAWERWNDYGIGLLLKGVGGASKGELRQAEEAFSQVEVLERADGALNLARTYLNEGRLDEAGAALRRASKQGAPPWSVAWFSGLVNKQNGFLDEAIENFKAIVHTEFTQARQREFDFSLDYRVLNELGETLFERANQERGRAHRGQREALLQAAKNWFDRTLMIDPENVTAHYNLALIYARLGERELANKHRKLHLKYKVDDNAQEHAGAIHRRANPAANHAAEAVAIYDLQRDGAYGLAPPKTTVAVNSRSQ